MKLSNIIIVFALFVSFPSAAHAQIVVQTYFLETRVINTSQFQLDTQAVENNSPISPIAFSQLASIDPSFGSTSYQLNWSGDTAQFDMTGEHHLQGFRGSISSGGRILVRPTVDSLVTASGFFNYQQPNSQVYLGASTFHMSITLNGSSTTLFITGGSGGTFDLDPPTGTFFANGSYLLQAGLTYRLNFSFLTNNFDVNPPANFVWSGNGEAHFTIAPVPEPVTALLLTLAAMAFHRRRRGK